MMKWLGGVGGYPEFSGNVHTPMKTTNNTFYLTQTGLGCPDSRTLNPFIVLQCSVLRLSDK